MKLQTVPAAQGLQWVRQAFQTFFARPIAFAALFATFTFAAFVLALVPTLGSLVVLAALPLVSLGFMIATREVREGRQPTPRVFVLPLQGERRRTVALLQLGVGYALATFAAMELSDWVDGGAFDALMDALPAGQTTPQLLADKLDAPGLLSGMLLRMGLSALLSVPFWHAPALVYWDGHGAAQALFSSTLACWRNRAAFSVYGVAWVGVIMLFGVIGSMVFALLGQAALFAFAAVPFSLALTTVFYVSLYFTFADCFVAGAAEPAPGVVP